MAKVSNSLTALSSAAILAVYAVGYHRTTAAADRFARQADHESPEPPIVTNFVAPAQALPSFKSTVAVRPENAPQRYATRETARNPEKKSTGSAPVVTPADPTAPPVEVPLPSTPAQISRTPAPVLEEASPDIPPPPPPPLPAALQYKDGTYTGWGSCRHGDVQASIVIEGGRIASAAIAQCYTRYPCTWIEHAPEQVVARQSIKVDYVSGATQSVDAFKEAVAEALAKAK